MSEPLGMPELLAREPILLVPGVYDALSATMAEAAGFSALYLSGASIAYTRLGRPDIGLVGMDEVAATISAISERIVVPLIVDADTGYGNALNVVRTVRLFERNGAAVIQLEDQSLPKRCGHLDGKTLVSAAEMVGKLKAALDARRSPRTLVMARTDAIAVEGLEAALDRAEAYLEAGADILFVEGPRSRDEMQAVCRRFSGRIPLLANMVEGGKTPLTPLAEREGLGYSIVIHPGGVARAVARTMQDYYSSLRQTGSTEAFLDRMVGFKGINEIVGTEEMFALGRRYEAE